ncbi:MAG: hypothetical protein LBT24_06975 [Tannerella sp.]|jgi:hypothetical protein|nr:hypothetical protein [Tannerella sp.]
MALDTKKRKGKAPSVRIPRDVGMWITYQLRLRGISLTEFAAVNDLTTAAVSTIFYGQRSSERIKKSVCETLGFSSLEELSAVALKYQREGK